MKYTSAREGAMTMTLLDPTNDYVFKRLFAERPDLLVALINDLRPDLPAITSTTVSHIL